jgi:hypothetical protein
VAGSGGGVITVGCGRRGLAIIVGSALALTLAVPACRGVRGAVVLTQAGHRRSPACEERPAAISLSRDEGLAARTVASMCLARLVRLSGSACVGQAPSTTAAFGVCVLGWRSGSGGRGPGVCGAWRDPCRT